MKLHQPGTYEGARERLEQLLADEPGIWSRQSLAAIARRLGVSRQRVKQLKETSTKPRPRPGADALRTYVAAHPEAFPPPEAGGPSTKTIARAYAKENILAYIVAPGVVRTRLSENFAATQGGEAAVTANLAMGEWVPPSDIAELVAFLATGRCRHLTGATLDVNGATYVR